jgi:hypothetical protein
MHNKAQCGGDAQGSSFTILISKGLDSNTWRVLTQSHHRTKDDQTNFVIDKTGNQ